MTRNLCAVQHTPPHRALYTNARAGYKGSGSCLFIMTKVRDAVPPGAILKQEFMVPLGLTVQQLAQDLHVPATQLQEVIDGKRPIKAGLALRLGRFFGVNPETWLNLQANFELRVAQREIGKRIEQLIMPMEAA